MFTGVLCFAYLYGAIADEQVHLTAQFLIFGVCMVMHVLRLREQGVKAERKSGDTWKGALQSWRRVEIQLGRLSKNNYDSIEELAEKLGNMIECSLPPTEKTADFDRRIENAMLALEDFVNTAVNCHGANISVFNDKVKRIIAVIEERDAVGE